VKGQEDGGLGRSPLRLHLDTDLGGDLDDLCALALVLAWPGVEVTGVTTVADEGGRRAGYGRHALALAGRPEVPVAAGADVDSGRFRYRPGYPEQARYWPAPVTPAPGPLEAALDLLEGSIGAGAIVVGIGPWTNLSLLERRRPGLLGGARLVLMGGHLRPAPPGFPAWGTADDYNVQMDVAAAGHVLEASRPTVVPLEVTVQTALRRADLPALRRAGPLGVLLAHQALAFAEDEQNEARYGRPYAGLPDDTINFQHDPLSCAVALGWPGARAETLGLTWREEAGLLRLGETDGAGPTGAPGGRAGGGPGGVPTRVVTGVDGPAFGELWLGVVARGQIRSSAD
jgi:inosine-uridine nucleoside N-ribohydrolase